MDWLERASCRGEDPELFFPVGGSGSGPTVLQSDEAKTVCAGCPVRRQCLDWAVDAGPVDGIWGGTTEVERRAMRRRHVPHARRPAATAA
ncbi:WhiB family transcriptional regulator [Streptomyces fuscigenes]|uniref:WhiB family transcriptional regulator n=1 Tax=Streptomyces fuscigenes TaxID=1528880 RepID=UPI001F3B9162|nr:WhiB family transcriptional regulator [Streptomyces fuscigenes]MCF3962705.1 WhiB family transcriptional regulator [Streptomyces fuscigenes]